MHDINKVIVFLFVLILLFYMIRLSIFVRNKWKLKTHTFILLFVGLLILTIATFLDMMSPLINNQLVYIIIRILFTLGAVFYIVGVIFWSNYTRKLIEELEELTLKDSMTELFNRKGIEKIYKLVFQTNQSFYVAVCDLDGLKRINDKFGHLKGDKYISSAAKIILDLVGTEGYVGRVGGDEFILILKYSNSKKVDELIAKIKQLVNEIFPEKSTGISIGYSAFPGEGNNLGDLMSLADEKMYTDKNSKKI